MVHNVIGPNGFVTTGPVDGSSTTEIVDFAQVPKWQARETGPATVSGSSIHNIIPFTTASVTHVGELDVWTGNKFTPKAANRIYTLRVDGFVPDDGFSGNPTFHIDFEMSGVIESGIVDPHSHDEETINRQTVDVFLRTQGVSSPNHYHVHAVYKILTTEDLVVSGGHLYATSSGPAVRFLSDTMLITEG